MEIYDQRNLVFDNRFLSSCVAVEKLAKEEMYTNQSFRLSLPLRQTEPSPCSILISNSFMYIRGRSYCKFR